MAKVTMIKALNDALRQEMKRNEKVFLMGEDIWRGCFGVTGGLVDEFGDRVVSTPISEKMIVGGGVGAAIAGMVPVVELMFSDFLACAYDEIINQAAKTHYMFGGQFNVGLVVRLPGGISRQASAQHSQSLEAVLAHIPGLKVVYPSNAADAAGLLVASIRDGNPIMFMEHKLLYGTKSEMEEGEILPIELGKGKIVREGKDLTIFATGQYVGICKNIADEYSEKGIDIEVLDPRCLVPFDKEMLFDSVKKTGKLIVVTEETKRGAWSGEVVANVVEEQMDCLKKAPIRLGALDTPCPFAPILEAEWIPKKEEICKAIDKLVE